MSENSNSKKMRNLTEGEKEFLKDNIASDYEEIEMNDSSDKPVIRKRTVVRTKSKKFAPWKKLSNWAAFFFLLPFLGWALLYLMIFRVESVLGNGSLEYLSTQEITPEVVEAAEKAGFGWLPTALEVYENRNLIILIMFIFFVAIAVVLMIIDVSRSKKLEEQENQQVAQKLQDERNESSDDGDEEENDDIDPNTDIDNRNE